LTKAANACADRNCGVNQDAPLRAESKESARCGHERCKCVQENHVRAVQVLAAAIEARRFAPAASAEKYTRNLGIASRPYVGATIDY